jgi:hypothetical protein
MEHIYSCRLSDQVDLVGDLEVYADCSRAISLSQTSMAAGSAWGAPTLWGITPETDFAIQGLGPEIQKTPV